VLYLDPPYHPDTRGKDRHNAYQHDLDASDHEELIARVKLVRASVLVSGYPHPLYDRALAAAGFERDEFAHSSTAARAPAGRGARTEVLWRRLAPAPRTPCACGRALHSRAAPSRGRAWVLQLDRLARHAAATARPHIGRAEPISTEGEQPWAIAPTPPCSRGPTGAAERLPRRALEELARQDALPASDTPISLPYLDGTGAAVLPGDRDSGPILAIVDEDADYGIAAYGELIAALTAAELHVYAGNQAGGDYGAVWEHHPRPGLRLPVERRSCERGSSSSRRAT
jgi:hypothetical protein